MYSYVQFCRAQLYTRLLYTTVRNVMLSVAASFILGLRLQWLDVAVPEGAAALPEGCAIVNTGAQLAQV